jgi:hypothetical protein
VEWTFTTLPRSWKETARNPMIINPRTDGLHFRGVIDYKGAEPDPLQGNSVMFTDSAVKHDTFYAIEYYGLIPTDNTPDVSVGVGAVVKRRSRQKGAAGIQLRRNPTEGTVEVRIEGARSVPVLKGASRSLNWIELPDVAWPAGKFAVRIEVADRRKGTFRAYLKAGDGDWVDVLKKQFPDIEDVREYGETSRIFSRGGGGGGGIQFYIWVEGSEGTRYEGIYLTKVKLVKGVKSVRK